MKNENRLMENEPIRTKVTRNPKAYYKPSKNIELRTKSQKNQFELLSHDFAKPIQFPSHFFRYFDWSTYRPANNLINRNNFNDK